MAPRGSNSRCITSNSLAIFTRLYGQPRSLSLLYTTYIRNFIFVFSDRKPTPHLPVITSWRTLTTTGRETDLSGEDTAAPPCGRTACVTNWPNLLNPGCSSRGRPLVASRARRQFTRPLRLGSEQPPKSVTWPGNMLRRRSCTTYCAAVCKPSRPTAGVAGTPWKYPLSSARSPQF